MAGKVVLIVLAVLIGAGLIGTLIYFLVKLMETTHDAVTPDLIIKRNFTQNQTLTYQREQSICFPSGDDDNPKCVTENLVFVLYVIKANNVTGYDILMKFTELSTSSNLPSDSSGSDFIGVSAQNDIEDFYDQIFRFHLSPLFEVTNISYPISAQAHQITMARSVFYQFAPNLKHHLYKTPESAWEEGKVQIEQEGSMYIKSNRIFFDRMNMGTIFRQINPEDFSNTEGIKTSLTYEETTTFNKTSGQLISSTSQQQVNLSSVDDAFYNDLNLILETNTLLRLLHLNESPEDCLRERLSYLQLPTKIKEPFFIQKANRSSNLNQSNSNSSSNRNGTSQPKVIASRKFFSTMVWGVNCDFVFRTTEIKAREGSQLENSIIIVVDSQEYEVITKKMITAAKGVETNVFLRMLKFMYPSLSGRGKSLLEDKLEAFIPLPRVTIPTPGFLQIELLFKFTWELDISLKSEIMEFLVGVEEQSISQDALRDTLLDESTGNPDSIRYAFSADLSNFFRGSRSFHTTLNVEYEAHLDLELNGGLRVAMLKGNIEGLLSKGSLEMKLIQDFFKKRYQLELNEETQSDAMTLNLDFVYLSCEIFPVQCLEQRDLIEEAKDIVNSTWTRPLTRSNWEREDDENLNRILLSLESTAVPDVWGRTLTSKRISCLMDDLKCFSKNPCGCSSFKCKEIPTNCEAFRKGIYGACSASLPMVDMSYISCVIPSCSCPYIELDKRTCDSKCGAMFRIGMNITLDENIYQTLTMDAETKRILSNFSNLQGCQRLKAAQELGGAKINVLAMNQLNTQYVESYVDKISKLYDARDSMPGIYPSDRVPKLFIELPRFLRTVIFLFMRKYYEDNYETVAFLRKLLSLLYKEKWSDFATECEINANLCSYYDLQNITSLMRYGCSRCDESALSGDLIIIMDSSNSISPNEFEQQKDFLERFISKTKRPDSPNLRVALINFSSLPKLEIVLTNDTNAILTTMRKTIALAEGTGTGGAFSMAADVFEQSSTSDTPKFAIILTDGQATDYYALGLTQLKSKRANIIAVGVGDELSVSELRSYATSKENVYMVDSFNTLSLIELALRREMCYGSVALKNGGKNFSLSQNSYAYFSIADSMGQGFTVSLSSADIDYIMVYGSFSHPYPNEFNNDVVGVLRDGKLVLSVTFSKTSDRGVQRSSSSLSSSSILESDRGQQRLSLGVIASKTTQVTIDLSNTIIRVKECPRNCSSCDPMGMKCFACNSGFIFLKQECLEPDLKKYGDENED